MIAGTMALLDTPADEPLEDYHAAGFTTVDVRETFGYLDGKQVQQGRVASLVEAETEEIHITENGSVETERIPEREQVWTEWVADVDDGGWFIAERTRGTNPTFPFETIRARTNRDVDPVRFDVPQFVRNQRDADRHWDVWMAGRKQEAANDYDVDHTNIAYGENATKKDAIQSEIGIGFETTWRGRVATGVLYQSGYVAIHNSSWTPEQFARFVDEELLPVASVPETDDEDEQATFEGGASA